jgi:hypothetical protein
VRKADAEYLGKIVALGCIVCRNLGYGYVPAEPHHMLDGGRRIGHQHALPLCYDHHRSGRNDDEVVSRDHNQRRFEARNGTEADLLAQVWELIGWTPR